jgi:hypothetical protein
VSRVLRPGGFVQFSVVHPTTSTPVRRWVDDESGERQALAIGDYFYQGPLTETWSFGAAPPGLRARHRPFTITYARRTLAGWLTAVLAAGLIIEAIAEPCADEATAAAHPQVADTRIAPYFLIVRARKPALMPADVPLPACSLRQWHVDRAWVRARGARPAPGGPGPGAPALAPGPGRSLGRVEHPCHMGRSLVLRTTRAPGSNRPGEREQHDRDDPRPAHR